MYYKKIIKGILKLPKTAESTSSTFVIFLPYPNLEKKSNVISATVRTRNNGRKKIHQITVYTHIYRGKLAFFTRF